MKNLKGEKKEIFEIKIINAETKYLLSLKSFYGCNNYYYITYENKCFYIPGIIS